ncbi:MAG: ATP-binding protein, partial [Campylobacter sp.]|nr:ATP-binding protein [Campylobacter sp.]
GELSSFCSLVDVKVSNFTHIFELLNVTDDDILQKIRAKIEEIVKKSSLNNKDQSLSSTPLQASSGSLDFETEGAPLDIIIHKDNLKSDLTSSTDGTHINLNVESTLHLEDTKTSNIPEVKSQENKQFKEEIFSAKESKNNEVKKQELKKEEKVPSAKKEGFFKRLFSFGKKKNKVKEEVSLGPLPIEQVAAKEADISKNEQKSKGLQTPQAPQEKNQKDDKNMHGVIVKGTAFPAEELGAQKIKEVSLETKPLFEKEHGEVLQAQVPLDDIFAAETICQFYDDQNPSEPKIEKIEDPTPMPTPRVITITQNKILEENLKQGAKQEGVKEEVFAPKEETKETPKKEVLQEKEEQDKGAQMPAASLDKGAKVVEPSAPVMSAAKVVAKQTADMPVLPKQPAAPILKKENQNAPQASLQQKDLSSKVIKTEEENFSKSKDTADNKTNMNLDKQENKMPKISVSEEEVLKMKNAAKASSQDKVMPKEQTDSKQTALKQGAKQNKPQAALPKATPKPIVMPPIDKTQIDGFDHTIQTTSIPVYKKSNWPIEMPIVPSYTLENMDMSSNRFAHATAMSIVDNPGTMYNPFFVFGEGGCGKTHFLNAIGVEFAKKISQDKIFITNGVRFSRGVQRAIENGTINKVKDFLDSAQVLIIDDIHLTAVNETNREFISQVLNDYVAKRKQLVIASKYPPQGLSRFEELTNFKLSQGWISELKPLRPNHFLKAYVKMALDAQVDLTEAQCRGFFGRENLTLGMIDKDIKRAKVLRRRIKDSGSLSISYEQLLNYITAISGEDTTSQLESLDLSSPLSIRRGENTNWGNFGFFFPKESADKFKWIVYATMQRAKELGIKGGFNFALKSAYSTEHIIASAFKIANVCDSKNLKAAIILGPDPKIIQPAIRDNFCDILSHMLEVMMIRCAIISYEDIKKPSSYVRVLGDVLK